MAAHDVGVDNFEEEVIGHSDETVFVDFWAEWCAPCKAVAPLYYDLSESFSAKFVKVDLEKNQGIASQYGIRSIPTFIAFKNGVEVSRMIGTLGLETFVEKYK